MGRANAPAMDPRKALLARSHVDHAPKGVEHALVHRLG